MEHIPWHSTGSSCRDVQEGSGTFPRLPMELHSHRGISHCPSPGRNQTLKQTPAVSFKPQKINERSVLSSLVALH